MIDYDPNPDPHKRLPSEEQLLATAVRYLIDGDEFDAANILLSCSMKWDDVSWITSTKLTSKGLDVTARLVLQAPRVVYELYFDFDHEAAWARELAAVVSTSNGTLPAGVSEKDIEPPQGPRAEIVRSTRAALWAVLPRNVRLAELSYEVKLVSIDPEWRDELLLIARGKSVHNQAIGASRALVWMNHNFRSQTEIKIAQALDQRKVLFFPNCKARLGIDGRSNLEPDFLIFHNGRWGILEIDGAPYHPPTRAAEDHTRDRAFKLHGIKIVEHFDAAYCWESPSDVVSKFLAVLAAA